MTVGELRYILNDYTETETVVIEGEFGEIYHIKTVSYENVEDLDENIFDAAVLKRE